MMLQSSCSIFLSAMTPLGFVSGLNRLCENMRFERILLLKGGGEKHRAELIAHAVKIAENGGKKVCRIASALCSDRLEAAFWENTAIINSAVPYCVEPRLPSVLEEVIWLGDFFDREQLFSKREQITALFDKSEQTLEGARRFLCAADELLNDNRRMAAQAVNFEKIKQQAARTAKKRLKKSGGLQKAFITRNSFGEKASFDLSGYEYIALQDEYNACAQSFLKQLFTFSKQIGCDVLTGYSPIAPYDRIEQLIFPNEKLVFSIENSSTKMQPDRVINSRRFTDKQRLLGFGEQLRFNKRAARQMMVRSALLFEQMAAEKAEIDGFYQSAVKKQAFEKFKTEKLISLCRL